VAAFELRPLKTGEILDGAITLMRRQFGVLFGIAVVCEGLPAVLDIYIDLTGGSAAQPGLALLERLLNLFGTMLVTGATVSAVSEAYLGRTPGLGDSLRYGLSKLGFIFSASIVSGLLAGLATLALVIPGIVVFCGYSVVAQVAALEPLKSGTDALRRSWMLTKGFKAKAFVLWIVAIVLIAALALGGGLLGGLAAAVNPALEPVSTVLLAILLLLYYPLLTCVFTLFYYDLRVRKEGFDLEVLATQLGGAPAA
jgi:hypothetical protein